MNPLEKAGHGMTYGGGTTAFLFGLDANTIGMICGVVIGVVGLAITWHYQRKRDRREEAQATRNQQEHELRMRGGARDERP